MKVAAIAVAGALGALARYGVSIAFGPTATNAFPWPTYAVNVSGSFLAGVLVPVFTHRFPGHEVLFAGLAVGFLGAFTTFSAFSLQTQQLIERGASSTALVYVFGSVVAGVAAAWLGVYLGGLLAKP